VVLFIEFLNSYKRGKTLIKQGLDGNMAEWIIAIFPKLFPSKYVIHLIL
jgi:hypothetical protein|tara:strand:+ start:45838 stop:45984 length:147 start_codon:yes stop_codon:yes gene_type:complete